MIDLIVFGVGSNRYAMNIENIQRIIQADNLTSIPNAHPYIDGMMSHEDSVIKVMSFRKLINYPSYEEELKDLFAQLKIGHKNWLDELKVSVDTGSPFTKTIDPHMCDLGKWIDGFTSYDDRVSEVLSELVEYHKQLHLRGGEACEVKKADPEEAKRIVEVDVNNIYNHTMGALDTFVKELGTVANSLQKLLIYEHEGKKFAVKVDTIEDIAHIEESNIMARDLDEESNEFLELDGVLDLNGVLINVIKTVKLSN
ncbi:MAG: chemotaxis signal transduction protein [Sulfurimonas sp.]|jgi:chemotaxis signal transduction protein|uniref:chemotaxis protein CheW n=1 Tax=Sulfurimonas sp. TaxID=2022749 RepID=UPI0039E6E291